MHKSNGIFRHTIASAVQRSQLSISIFSRTSLISRWSFPTFGRHAAVDYRFALTSEALSNEEHRQYDFGHRRRFRHRAGLCGGISEAWQPGNHRGETETGPR